MTSDSPELKAPRTYLSFLRLPTFTLASLAPVLPLPSHLQHRLLSFLLRRTVGKYLTSTIDLSSLSSDLARGSAALARVELDSAAINPLLEGSGLQLISGTIGRISAQLSFPAIQLALEDIELVLASLPSTPHTARQEEEEERKGLEASVLSVAEEFVHEEEGSSEDDEVDDPEEWLPGAFTVDAGTTTEAGETLAEALPEKEKVTLLASIIERVLSRLGVTVDRVVVRFEGAELRVGRVVYSGKEGDVARKIEVDGVEVWLLRLTSPPPPRSPKPLSPPGSLSTHLTPAPPSPSPTSSSSSFSASDDDEITENDDMIMSQSIADLRSSVSFYASATGSVGESRLDATEEEEEDPFEDPDEVSVGLDGGGGDGMGELGAGSGWDRSRSLEHPQQEYPHPTSPPAPASPTLHPLSSSPVRASQYLTSASLHLPQDAHLILTLGSHPLVILLSPTLVSITSSSSLCITLKDDDIGALLDLGRKLPSPAPPAPAEHQRQKEPSVALNVELEWIELILALSPRATLNFALRGLSLTEKKASVTTAGAELHVQPESAMVLLEAAKGNSVTKPLVVVELERREIKLASFDFRVPLTLVDHLLPFLRLLSRHPSPFPSSPGSSTSTLPGRPAVDLLTDLESSTVSPPSEWNVICEGRIRVEVDGGGRGGKVGIEMERARTGGEGWARIGVREVKVDWCAVGTQDIPKSFLKLSPFPNSSTSLIPLTRSEIVITPDSVRIPRVEVTLGKGTIEGLWFFADDVVRWVEGLELSTGTTAKAEPWDAEFGPRKEVWIEEIEVELRVPTKDGTGIRPFIAKVSDFELGISPADLILTLRLADLALTSSSHLLLSRTLARNRSVPQLAARLELKEGKVKVAASNFTAFVRAELEWVEELMRLLESPAGAFDTVVPSERTLLRLTITDGSLHVSPPSLPSAIVVLFEHLKISTDLIKDLPTLVVAHTRGTRVLAVEGRADLSEPGAAAATGASFWKSMGYVQFIQLEKGTLELHKNLETSLPDIEALLSDTRVVVALCADTLPAVGACVTDFTGAFRGPEPTAVPVPIVPPPARHLTNNKHSLDLLSSVDPRAFHHAPSLNDVPEYLDDDVPTNIDYLADALREPHASSLLTKLLPRRNDSAQAGTVISDIDGETIRMLDPKGLRVVDGFLKEPRVDPADDPNNQPLSVVKVRVSRCDVTVHIHEGFDWQTTRKAIQDEAKRVRKRLEKIRQLLASGQSADASAEDASVLVFGSVQLGLPPGASDLPAGQLLDAINEELEDGTHGDGESNAETWQSLPGQSAARRQTSVGRARKRLTRSSAYAIEANLHDIVASFDLFPTTTQVASRVRVDVGSVEIIDNIRTSTWRKFLTELRASDGGLVRESGASMIRFELQKVRSEEVKASSLQEEILLKIKISPLRLYIDQDALDFLKAFGAFRVPIVAGTEIETATVTEPFFQRVEILPVKIKLDYKPKRVDYHALRQGKMAELMNFFHFDGSEMTLRHLVVTGVSGSTRLSELVQDIWTPDVKANQLADVISGIAPVRSVVNLGSGVANLVLLPIEQYRKDGRLARGLQRGVASFSRSTTLEALNVGARLATGTQVILEQAESVFGARFSGAITTETLAPGSGERASTELSEQEQRDLISRYAEQPGDLREGMESAYRSLGDNFRSAAQTILAVPMEVYERSGTEGPVRAVIRAVPVAVLKPMIGASEAVSKVLFGLRNSLDPDAQTEAADKFKSRSPSS